jgi:hypothetical protein
MVPHALTNCVVNCVVFHTTLPGARHAASGTLETYQTPTVPAPQAAAFLIPTGLCAFTYPTQYRSHRHARETIALARDRPD